MKSVKYFYNFYGKNSFTGIVKDKNNNIVYYSNGKFHREDGPAIEYSDGYKSWYLNGTRYGVNDDFINESWIRVVKLELLK